MDVNQQLAISATNPPEPSQTSNDPRRPPSDLKRVFPDLPKVEAICEDCDQSFMAVNWPALAAHLEVIPKCHACFKRDRLQGEISKARLYLPQADEETRKAWYHVSGLQGKWLTKTFENFDRAKQPQALDAVKGYSGGSFVLVQPGEYGAGKTHLVSALANHLLSTTPAATLAANSTYVRKQPCPVYFTTENDMLDRIRATFGHKNDGHETDEQVYRLLIGVGLLIIDDVGKRRPNDPSFLQDVYFKVINARDTNSRPVVMTTNLDYNGLEAHLGGATADRLRGMCGKDGFIKISGKSQRR